MNVRTYIVIVDSSGLTYVSRCKEGELEQSMREGTPLLLKSARCVVRWGTTQHLAELVNGPTKSTTLGSPADVLLRQISVAYPCVEGSWDDALPR